MRVTLNCHRAGYVPGDVVDLDDGEAAPLLALGAAFPVEETAELAPSTSGATTSTTPKPAAAAPPQDAKAVPAPAAEASAQSGS